MYQFVVTFRDPSLGHKARKALAELIGATPDDERLTLSPTGAILVASVDDDQRGVAAGVFTRFRGTVRYEKALTGGGRAA